MQLIYYVAVKNTGNRACVAPHFLAVEAPRKTAASIAVQPRVGGDLAPAIDLSQPLVVQPGKSVGATVLLDTPCGHIVGTNAVAKIVFAVEDWPARPTSSINADVCRTEPNQVEVWPLAHP